MPLVQLVDLSPQIQSPLIEEEGVSIEKVPLNWATICTVNVPLSFPQRDMAVIYYMTIQQEKGNILTLTAKLPE